MLCCEITEARMPHRPSEAASPASPCSRARNFYREDFKLVTVVPSREFAVRNHRCCHQSVADVIRRDQVGLETFRLVSLYKVRRYRFKTATYAASAKRFRLPPGPSICSPSHSAYRTVKPSFHETWSVARHAVLRQPHGERRRGGRRRSHMRKFVVC
jgi:hypothetical protein